MQTDTNLIPITGFFNTQTGQVTLDLPQLGTATIAAAPPPAPKPFSRFSHVGKTVAAFKSMPYRSTLAMGIQLAAEIVGGNSHPKLRLKNEGRLVVLFNQAPEDWCEIAREADANGYKELRPASVIAARHIARHLDREKADEFFADLRSTTPTNRIAETTRQSLLDPAVPTVKRIEIMLSGFRAFADLPWRPTLAELAKA